MVSMTTTSTTTSLAMTDLFLTLTLGSAGKTTSLFRHDLVGLHSKQTDRLTISMNAMHKIPAKFVPKKFAMTSKVANTKGCSKCCVGRNPYNGYKYLCGATPNGVFLMQWYDPLNKFMLLKVRLFHRSRIEDAFSSNFWSILVALFTVVQILGLSILYRLLDIFKYILQ